MQMWWSSIFTRLVAPGSPLALIFLNEALMATCFDNFFFPVHSWISHACWSIQEISSSLAFFFLVIHFCHFGGIQGGSERLSCIFKSLPLAGNQCFLHFLTFWSHSSG